MIGVLPTVSPEVGDPTMKRFAEAAAMAAGLDRPVSAEGACCSRQQDPALPDQGRGP